MVDCPNGLYMRRFLYSSGRQEARIPLVTSRLVKQPQYITLPSTHFNPNTNSLAPDYGSTAFHSKFTRRPPPSDRDGSSVRYIIPRPADSTDHHSYSSATFGQSGNMIARRPTSYVISGQRGVITGSPPQIRSAAGMTPAVTYEGYTGSGESDYSDIDSLGSNSNQGF